ncbi:MAG TPA: hypothetical protein VHG29_09960 [Novosphingobium sp.]|nr:hypothetical protein [Novosphingobium sp.]
MAKAFAQGMKDIGSNIAKHYETAASKVAEVSAKPNATEADYKDAFETVEREFKAACSETGTTASNAAREEFEEHILKGLDPQAVERWFEQKAKSVKDLAEEARPHITQAVATSKAVLAAAVAVLVGFEATLWSYARDPRPAEQKEQILPTTAARIAQIDIPPPIPTFAPPDLGFMLPSDEFGAVISGLDIPTIPLSAFGIGKGLVVEPYRPPHIELPEPIAAAALAPVQIVVRQGESTYTGTTTVQRAYETIPQAQEQIEESIRESRNERSEPHLQVDIDIDTDFAGAHFHIH